MLGNLTTAETLDVLSKNVLGRIGCCRRGLPYVVPISYAFEDQVVYCRTAEGMKLKIMRDNPHVCFEVEEFTDMANWRTVIAWGDFEEITDAGQRAEAIGYLAQRHLPIMSSETTHLSASWPFLPENLGDISGIIFKIKLQKMSGRFEKFVRE